MARRNEELVTDLLVEQVTSGLSDHDAQRLAELLDSEHDENLEGMELAAATATVAFQRRDTEAEPMPDRVRSALVAEGMKRLPRSHPDVIVLDQHRRGKTSERQAAAEQPAPVRAWGGLGWAVAAGLALALVMLRPVNEPTPLSADAGRAQVQAYPDAVEWAWRPGDGVQGWEGVRGDVVWSDSAQQGYMRFVGLPVNDPGRSQYQLWIVDPDRDSRPVDGGVFDAGSSGEIIVPIQAKLPIGDPKAFAITEEQPGGVVVSDGPLVLVASLGPRPAST